MNIKKAPTFVPVVVLLVAVGLLLHKPVLGLVVLVRAELDVNAIVGVLLVAHHLALVLLVLFQG